MPLLTDEVVAALAGEIEVHELARRIMAAAILHTVNVRASGGGSLHTGAMLSIVDGTALIMNVAHCNALG